MTKTKATRRGSKARSGSRKGTARKSRPAPSIALHQAPKATQKRVLLGVQSVLRQHGISGQLTAMHFAATAPAEPAPGGPEECPPGTIRRVVCSRQDDGTVSCEEKCVPVAAT